MMPNLQRRPACRGFALVVALLLAALLVLVLLALSNSLGLGSGLASASEHQLQARQNALLGLGLALRELERHAGRDDALTGMAGIAGVGPGAAGGRRRHWCGVWSRDGEWRAWLSSGAAPGATPRLESTATPIVLVGPRSVGAEAANSEHVAVGRLPIALRAEEPAQGGYAWWVGDEGVKVPAHATSASVRVLPSATPGSSAALRAALLAHADRLPAVLMFEQLRFLPSRRGPLLNNSAIWDSFHHVTLGRFPTEDPNATAAPRINLNTTSAPVWRALFEAYNSAPGASLLSSNRIGTLAARVSTEFAAAAGAGKDRLGPFRSVEAFAQSGLLAELFPDDAEPRAAEVIDILAPVLAVRSDTFRIRAYGDAINPATSVAAATETVAVARCEAIVRRRVGPFVGESNRFAVEQFRWLGPDDI